MATHEIGDKVYYTGDRANRARWLTVQSVSPDGAVLSGSVVLRDADAPDYVVGVPLAMIGDTYRGHHDPRYVTWDAYNAYHREIYLARLATTVKRALWAAGFSVQSVKPRQSTAWDHALTITLDESRHDGADTRRAITVAQDATGGRVDILGVYRDRLFDELRITTA